MHTCPRSTSAYIVAASALSQLLSAPGASAQVTVQPLLLPTSASVAEGANTGTGSATVTLTPTGCTIEQMADAIAFAAGDEPAASAEIASSACGWLVSVDEAACGPDEAVFVLPMSTHSFVLVGSWGGPLEHGVYATFEATATSLGTTSSFWAVQGNQGKPFPTEFETHTTGSDGSVATTSHTERIVSVAAEDDTETTLYGPGGAAFTKYGFSQTVIGGPLLIECGESVVYLGAVSAYAEIQSLGDPVTRFGGMLMATVDIGLRVEYVIASPTGQSEPAFAVQLPPKKLGSDPGSPSESDAPPTSPEDDPDAPTCVKGTPPFDEE